MAYETCGGVAFIHSTYLHLVQAKMDADSFYHTIHSTMAFLNIKYFHFDQFLYPSFISIPVGIGTLFSESM